jgi:glycerol-3-phosphate acyltransferase PlsY
MTDKNKSNQSFLRAMALIAMLIGAIGSLYFMFNAGRNQKSVLLLGLFTAWVFSPFVGLLIAKIYFNRLTVSARSSLYWLMLALTICSLVSYSNIFIPPQTKPAFIFLIVPLASWFLIVTVFLIAKRISRKSNDLNS